MSSDAVDSFRVSSLIILVGAEALEVLAFNLSLSFLLFSKTIGVFAIDGFISGDGSEVSVVFLMGAAG